MDAQPLLSLRLSVDYPGKLGVLRNLSLDIASREILGLVGTEWLREEHARVGHPETASSEKRPRRGLDSLQWPRPDGVAANEKFDLCVARKLDSSCRVPCLR